MFDEATNQLANDIEVTSESTPTTIEVDDGSDLLIDEEEDAKPTNESSDEDEQKKSIEQNNSEEKNISQNEFLKVKFNGAEQTLSQEQAIELAQKGLNYDKVFNRVKELENSSEVLTLKKLAKAAGVEVSDYLNSLEMFSEKAAVESIAQQLREKYPDSSEELIAQMANTQYKNQVGARQSAEQNAKKMAEENHKAEMIRQIDAFEKEYPNVDIKNLPQDVVDLMKNQGFTLLAAYKAHDLEETKKEMSRLQSELEATKRNKTNEEKATGSLSKTVKKDEESDPFLQGFLSK